tara:strand:- start:181 stop:753 length:573 start_codon:yes stop_codon:yes gene_type:complete
MPKNNTIIDKSHSKKELLHIINYFNITTGLSQKNNKHEIATNLWDIVSKTDYIHIPKDNQFLIEDIQQLRLFLKNQNPKKRLSVKEKDNISFKTKKLHHYCINNYCIETSFFEDIIDVYNTASSVSVHGDLPIVRKVLRLLKNDPKQLYNIEPKISPEMMKEIHIKKKLKKRTSNYKCDIKHGTFIITFD